MNVSDKDNVKGPLKRLPGFKVGRAGVEKVYDAALRGKEGARQIEVNAFGQEIRELNRKVGDPGNEVWLTVDKELQRFTTNRLNSQSASAVVIDVHTGEVLALVTAPSYDPNLMVGRKRSKNSVIFFKFYYLPCRPLFQKTAIIPPLHVLTPIADT